MYKNETAADRKLSVMIQAGQRYMEKAPEIARTAAKLAAGGPLAAASPALAAKYLQRESAKMLKAIVQPSLPLGVERMIGGSFDWTQIAPSVEARRAGRPVARIVELANMKIGEGYATGFVIAPGLLVTNWHVFDSASDTRPYGAQFNFEFDDSGNTQPTAVFEFDPERFFYSNKDLDIALVAIADKPCIGSGVLENFGDVRLNPTRGKILAGQAINIIQHPEGRQKYYAMQKNTVYVEPTDTDDFLMYTTDTLEGSSGSPAFNKDWELVAVHHGGVPRVENGRILTRDRKVWKKGMPETDIDWVANEGARVSKIVAHLCQVRTGNRASQAILDQVVGTAGEVATEALVNAGQSTQAAALVTTPASGSVTVNVNGTANFYMGGAAVATPVATIVPVAQSSSTHLLASVAGQLTTTEAKLRYDPDYRNRPGYKADFLADFSVPEPIAPKAEVYVGPDRVSRLKYYHYSLVMHKKRRLAIWTASNVDYDKNKRRRKDRKDFGTDGWKADPRIPDEQQIEDLEFYAPAKKFDRGHLVRRDDSAWGETAEEEEFANSDTFHWTNCTPQHEEFNRDKFQYHGIWGGLENHIASQAKFVDKKLIVFAGPVLARSDPEHDFGSGIKVKMPMAFWKIVVVAEEQAGNRELRAYGFILDQREAIAEHGLEARFEPGEFVAQQVPLSEITDRTRVRFRQVLHDADSLAIDSTESRRRILGSLEDVKL